MIVSSSLKTVGIDHVVLHVSDMERSKAFYIGLLGMSVAHEGGGHTFLHCGEQVVALFEAPAGASLRRAWSSTTSRSGWTAASA